MIPAEGRPLTRLVRVVTRSSRDVVDEGRDDSQAALVSNAGDSGVIGADPLNLLGVRPVAEDLLDKGGCLGGQGREATGGSLRTKLAACLCPGPRPLDGGLKFRRKILLDIWRLASGGP